MLIRILPFFHNPVHILNFSVIVGMLVLFSIVQRGKQNFILKLILSRDNNANNFKLNLYYCSSLLEVNYKDAPK